MSARGRGCARHLSRTGAMLVMAVFTLYFLVPIWWLLVASEARGDLFSTNPLWFADLACSTTSATCSPTATGSTSSGS